MKVGTQMTQMVRVNADPMSIGMSVSHHAKFDAFMGYLRRSAGSASSAFHQAFHLP